MNEAILYIPTLPSPDVVVAGSLFANQRERIRINIETTDIKAMIAAELANAPEDWKKRVKPVIDEQFLSAIKIPINENYAEEMKTNPVVSNYKLDSSLTEREYVLVFTVKKYGYNGSGYTKKLYIDSVASLHNVKTNAIVWRYKDSQTTTIGLFDSAAEKKENIQKGITDCLKPMIKNCFSNINN